MASTQPAIPLTPHRRSHRRARLVLAGLVLAALAAFTW